MTYRPDPWGMRWGKRLLVVLLVVVAAELVLTVIR